MDYIAILEKDEKKTQRKNGIFNIIIKYCKYYHEKKKNIEDFIEIVREL